MMNYTKAANERCFRLNDKDIFEIWDSVEELAEEKTITLWKEKLRKLSKEYTFSSRFALMRILYSREMHCDLHDSECEEEFKIVSEGQEYKFYGLNYEKAETMSEKELSQYERILNDIALRQKDADAVENKYLIAKALRDYGEVDYVVKNEKDLTRSERNKKKRAGKTLLTRDEAMKLGHILKFSIEEMSWFLLRVFEFETGFQRTSSNDLIEAYGFLRDYSWKQVEKLKKDYNDKTKNVLKADVSERDTEWTSVVQLSLEERIEEWALAPLKCDDYFMEWLVKQAKNLDMPSRTTTSIYQRLAAYIYEISEKNKDLKVTDFVKQVKKICKDKTEYADQVKEYLMVDNVEILKKLEEDGLEFIGSKEDKAEYTVFNEDLEELGKFVFLGDSEDKKALKKAKKEYAKHRKYILFNENLYDIDKSSKFCENLLYKNLLYSVNPNFAETNKDSSKMWRMVYADKQGKLHLKTARQLESVGNRVLELLLGMHNVEKNDMLQLLWFGFNVCWSGDPIQSKNLAEHFFDYFLETVKLVLDYALLPEFYPPHVMEQSMLLSMIISVLVDGENDEYVAGSPIDHYFMLCQSLV